MNAFSIELRYTLRALSRTPVFTLSAVATVAIALAATTAVFSLVNAVYFRTLPYVDPDRLLLIQEISNSPECRTGCAIHLPEEQIARLAIELSPYATTAIGHDTQATLATPTLTQVPDGVAVSPNFLSLLGVQPAIGRAFIPSDTLASAESPMILSAAYWQETFNGDSLVVGQAVTLDGVPHRIVGVLSHRASLGPPLFMPSEPTAPYLVVLPSPTATVGAEIGFTIVARPREGVTREAFESHVHAMLARAYADAQGVAKSHPTRVTIRVISLRDAYTRAFSSVYPVFLGAVLALVGIACANLAGLFIARLASRHREIALRSALGANPARLLRLGLIEPVLICAAGTVAGLLLARWSLGLARALPLKSVPYWTSFAIDWRVVTFALLLAGICVLLFGLLPAALMARSEQMGQMRATGTAGWNSAGLRRARKVLIGFQVASAVMLLSCGGLLAKTLWTAAHIETGVAKSALLFGAVDLTDLGKNATDVVKQKLAARLVGHLSEMPQVRSAAAAGSGSGRPPQILTSAAGEAMTEFPVGSVTVNIVSPGYFSVLGLALRQGREFSTVDRADAPLVAIVDDHTARILYHGRSPIGERIKLGSTEGPEPWRKIVGVFRSPRLSVVGAERPARPTVYVPMGQAPFSTLRFIVRTRAPSATAMSAVRRAAHDVAPTLSVADLKPIETLIEAQLAPLQINAIVVGFFGAAGALLSAIGIYGIIAFGIAQQRSAIAVRIALGARTRDILRVTLGEAAVVAAIGVAIGLTATLAGIRVIRSLIYNTDPLDPWGIGAATVTTILFVVAASVVPARRATRIDPTSVLRM